MTEAEFLRNLADQHAETCKRLREIAALIESDNERNGRYVRAVGELADVVCGSWQCQACGAMHSEPYCPCSAEKQP